jgi:hypothetical protein
MDSKLRQHCQRRKAALLAERSLYESDWRQVAEYVDPFAGRYLQQQRGTRKLPSRAKILNNTATRALRTMDAGFMGGHTSKARPWFTITVPAALGELAEQADVRAWCDDVTGLIRDTLAKSNFYTALPIFYHSRHAFGVGVLCGDEDPQDVVRWYSRNIGTYAVGFDHRGICDSLWYEYERTARQIKQEFEPIVGMEGLPSRVQEALRGGKEDTKFMVQSLLEPNPDKKPGIQGPLFRPFRQIYWIDGAESETHGCLDMGGHYEMRALCSRWDVTGDVYGPSPAIDSLGDIKQLQYLEGEKLRLIDLLAKPPLGLPDSMRNRQASLEPGSKTYITPMQTQQQVGALYTPDARGLQAVQADIAELQKRIEAAFYVDLFRMLDFLDERQRTAYEISERKEEKVAMLGPALESLTDEVLDPAVTLTYASLSRAGLIPPVPEALDKVPLVIEYTSIMALALKAAGLGTIERTIGFAVQIAQARPNDPGALDKIDFDQAIDEFHSRAGSPARIIRSDDAVAAMRESRNQAAQTAQLKEMAPAMKQGMEALKIAGESVPQDGSVLERLGGSMPQMLPA